LANAPRALNEPECCNISSLKVSNPGARPKSAPSAATRGVRRMKGRMAFSVAAMRSRVIGAI
jgi:hypothetical protein